MSDGHGEVVIIKRHGGDHDDHHGGAWKIAFADFMCALMAFFLVMWLVSANDKTRASVARYFNPVRLVDATTQPKGLHDVKKDESGITSTSDTKTTDTQEAARGEKSAGAPPAAAAPQAVETAAGKDKRLDAALQSNPLVALAEIAGKKGPGEAPKTLAVASKAPVIGRRGGDAFRDPFAPPPPSELSDATDSPNDDETDSRPKPAAKKGDGEKDKETAIHQQTEIKEQILASIKGAGPAIDVRKTPEGILVSLVDTADFAMFSSGSAVPSKRLVLLMDQVAQVLKTKPGQVVVRGYTDNKPFHSSRYDNWHLSLDRAQVMHYMLIRGGIADARMGHVEGYADHSLKPGVDPGSAMNRRIEILLKDEKQ